MMHQKTGMNSRQSEIRDVLLLPLNLHVILVKGSTRVLQDNM